MEKSNKLKIVFDFIADYLIEEESTNSTKVINKKENSEPSEEVNKEECEESRLKRAYSIMKKMDEMDKESALTNRVSQHIKKTKSEEIKSIENEDELINSFKERTGVTLDDTGKISKIKVGPINEYTKISDILKNSDFLNNSDILKYKLTK